MKNLLSVVVNYKTYDLLEEFLKSYWEFVDQEDRALVVVDVEGSVEIPSRFKYYPVDTWLTDEDNIGYARAVNWAVDSQSDLDFDNIAIFNSDTKFLDSNCVDSCLDLLNSNEGVGVVGPMQYDSKGRITHAGIFGTNEQPFHRAWLSRDIKAHKYIADCVTVSGSAYFIKRSVWDELTECPTYRESDPDSRGAFLNTKLFWEETFCSYHAREHGYRILYNGEAEMIHEWHQSVKENQDYSDSIMADSQAFFREACEHHGILHD